MRQYSITKSEYVYGYDVQTRTITVVVLKQKIEEHDLINVGMLLNAMKEKTTGFSPYKIVIKQRDGIYCKLMPAEIK